MRPAKVECQVRQWDFVVSTRVIRCMLFDTTPTDTTTFIAVPIVLTLAAIVASYLSAPCGEDRPYGRDKR
jgi:hypothetical protein